MTGCVYTDNFQCAQCKKPAYKNASWAYKRKGKSKTKKLVYFCSYSCMRAWDRAHDVPKKNGRV